MKARVTVPVFDGSLPSLGYGVIRWIETTLLQPDGEHAGEPYRLTREQKSFVLWLYAVDGLGRFLYRRAVLRRAKGWGKSPFIAALCLAELCGPVIFSHFDAAGRAVGKPHPAPWVIVAGVSEKQTENTLRSARGMARDSELAQENGGPLDVGKTRIIHTGHLGTLESITASSASQEGARPTFAVADEPHHWTKSNGGHALMRVIRRNLAKVQGRLVETTNAHEPTGGGDEASSAEKSYRAWIDQRDGKSQKRDILYDSREAPALTPEQLAHEPTLREALRLAYGDSTWVDLDPIVGEIYDSSTPVEEGRRFYLNQIVAASDAWLRPDDYEACESDAVPPLAPGETITLGFDGSLTDDSTVLVGVRVEDGAPFLLGVWERPTGAVDWEVDKELVRGLVAQTFERYDVVAFFADYAYWETDVDTWRERYSEQLLVKATAKHAIAWDMRSHLQDTTIAIEALRRSFVDHEIPISATAPNAAKLREHVLNARKRPNRWGVGFGKATRESPLKVDALAGLLLARMARTRLLGEGVLRKRKRRTGQLIGF